MKRISRYLSGERGIALVLVLWVLTLLTMIAAEFTLSMRVENKAVSNFKDETKAYYLAIAGVNMSLAEIRAGKPFIFDEGSVIATDESKKLFETMGQWREMVLGDGSVSYLIEDEQGKLNLNTAARESVENLLRICGIESEQRDIIADSIMDWRDINHEHHLNGAEDEYYQSLPQPYEAKDDFFDTTEELLLIRGMTPKLFYGNKNMPPGLVSPSNKSNTDDRDLKCKNLSRYLTVNGNGKVNINTAEETVLEAVFGKGITAEILLRRERGDFFRDPVYGGAVRSNVFRIIAMGEVNGIKTSIMTIFKRGNEHSSLTAAYWNERFIFNDTLKK